MQTASVDPSAGVDEEDTDSPDDGIDHILCWGKLGLAFFILPDIGQEKLDPAWDRSAKKSSA